jgi:FdhE protein
VPSTQLSRTRDWDHRIQRARELSGRFPDAAEVLTFYQRIAGFQKSVFDLLAPSEQSKLDTAATFRSSIDTARAVGDLPALLSIVDEAGTAVLKETARDLRSKSQRELLSIFDRYAMDIEIQESADCFFPRVCLQPYVELLAVTSEPRPGFVGDKCLLCGGKPQLAVLRPEGDGGKRFLLCSFCFTEWEYRRVLCPTCGEVDYQKLPRYAADDLSWVRVDACDTCQYYLKSIDMTVEGLAAPIVDEIATAPLDLWAVDHGYKKTHQNLMGF